MDEGTYTRLTGDRRRTGVSVLLGPGANIDTVGAALRSAVGPGGPGVTVSRPQDIRRQALQAFDRSFLITYLLEGIAVCVGLAGVAATIGAQVLSRMREFGMLRHVGALRGDLVRMLLIEGALLGLVGGVAGVALGVAMSQVLIHVVNPQSFHWTMDTLLPWPLLAGSSPGWRWRRPARPWSWGGASFPPMPCARCGRIGDALASSCRAVVAGRSRRVDGPVTASPMHRCPWMPRLCCRATTVRIPISSPSGGTSPGGCTRRAARWFPGNVLPFAPSLR